VKGSLLDERGMVMVVLLLIVVPLMVAGILLTAEHPRSVHGADVDLGQAVAEAVRAAAMCVDDASQAHGDPRVDPDRAHATLRYILARNLGLSDTTLEPLEGSGMLSASYVLVVYNGDNAWVPGAREYAFAGGTCSERDLTSGGFPETFAVEPDGITRGSGERAVTLDAPGCVAVVRATVRPVLLRENTEAVRWAAAKIVMTR